MNAARLLLRLQLALARLGWVRALTALAALAAVLVWSVWLPLLQQRAAGETHALQRAQSAALRPVPLAPPAMAGPDRVAEFYDLLGEQRHAEQQLKTVFALAQKNGVILNAAEYQTSLDKNSHVHEWHIALPVKGTYAALRRFAEQVLLAIPFAALDELRFKREAIAAPLLDARLRFTLYLSDVPPQRAERER